MNIIRALRTITKMSQNRFAAYLGIPVANIQHWEQGVSTPPSYLVALISRVMKHEGYLSREMTPLEVEALNDPREASTHEHLSPGSEADDIAELIKLIENKTKE